MSHPLYVTHGNNMHQVDDVCDECIEAKAETQPYIDGYRHGRANEAETALSELEKWAGKPERAYVEMRAYFIKRTKL